MGRRDNLKILTTAILVVLLLSSFIFAFIYRNEIYQKLQTIGKNKEVEMVDREIAKSPDTIPPPSDNLNDRDNRESMEDRTKLPELPSLEDMEPDSGRPRSVSVASGAKTKDGKESGSRLQEKLDQVEEQFSPKEKVPSQSKPATKDTVKKQTEENTETYPKEKVESIVESKPQTKSKKSKVQKESSYVNAKQKRNKNTNTSYPKSQYSNVKETKISKKTSPKQNGSNSNLEVRMKEVEQKLTSQNDRNEKRFLEIERRIDSLEKSLAK